MSKKKRFEQSQENVNKIDTKQIKTRKPHSRKLLKRDSHLQNDQKSMKNVKELGVLRSLLQNAPYLKTFGVKQIGEKKGCSFRYKDGKRLQGLEQFQF